MKKQHSSRQSSSKKITKKQKTRRSTSDRLQYHRIILKVSGEMLGGHHEPFSRSLLDYTVKQVIASHRCGVKIGIVPGAGNLVRGREMRWVDSISADQCGMVATVINGIIIRAHLQENNIPVRLSSGIEIPGIVNRCNKQDDRPYYDAGTVLILVGGTGNPLFTTDTAAALRAVEFDADIVIKATKVEGVYSAHPEKNQTAKLYKKLRFEQAIAKNLEVMDLAAFDICREAGIPICVYDFAKYPLESIVKGKKIGTLVTRGG